MLPTPPVHLSWLTGLRWWGALAIFILHMGVDWPATPFLGQMLVGMSFFFILSGFIIAWSWNSATSKSTFWWRRFIRLWPFMTVSLLLALLILPTPANPLALVLPFLALQGWSPNVEVYFALNPPLVSLTAEVFFYLIAPFLIPYFLKFGRKGLLLWLAGLTSFTLIFHASLPLESMTEGLLPWLAMYAPPVRALEFAIGIIVGLLVRKGVRAPVGVMPALALTLAATFLSYYAPLNYRAVAVTLIPFILLFWVIAQRELEGTIGRCPTWMVRLGEASFIFYLAHRLVLLGLVHHNPGIELTVPIAVACCALLALASIAIHRYLEGPLTEKLRTLKSK